MKRTSNLAAAFGSLLLMTPGLASGQWTYYPKEVERPPMTDSVQSATPEYASTSLGKLVLIERGTRKFAAAGSASTGDAVPQPAVRAIASNTNATFVGCGMGHLRCNNKANIPPI